MTERPPAPSYPIHTERLLIRPIDPVGDIDALHAYFSLEEACTYTPRVPRTREEVAETFANPERHRSVLEKEGDGIALAVVLGESSELIGDLVLMWTSAEHQTAEIGYAIHPDQHGRGYATEGARALLGVAFDVLGFRRVTARIDELNPASGRVLTKIGMRQEAVLVENEWFKGRLSTAVDYAMLDREWRALNA